VAALAVHAFDAHSDALHMQMFLVEAALVAMITGLSLQSVAYLYRSAVEHHIARHDLAQLAKYDALTGLANRLLLRERFQAAMASATRGGHRIALHFLDLDGFKAVNDGLGHPCGDALLEQVAHRLEAVVRAGDTVARLGGDEFVILQGGIGHDDEARIFAQRVIRRLSQPYNVGGKVASVSASIGIAIAPREGTDLEQLLAAADLALYRAKAGGKARAMCGAEAEPIAKSFAA
jgi:diguanylate cyclase